MHDCYIPATTGLKQAYSPRYTLPEQYSESASMQAGSRLNQGDDIAAGMRISKPF
jgi:hypothetical protein